MPKELKELRKNVIKDLCKLINNGRDIMGRDVILAGDFNTFPSDKILDPILGAGLEDTIIFSSDRYQNTWSPNSYIPSLARIDYIFSSKNLSPVYLETFIIKGSDHKGLITGINIK